MNRNTRRTIAGLLLVAPAVLLLAATFLAPLARLLALSLSAKGGTWAAYAALFEDDVYRTVLRRTVTLAAIVTALTLAIGFPIAVALTRLSRSWRAVLTACVLAPLWISVLVRTFAWMLLLERNGPINRALLDLGLIAHPLPLLFNTAGVVIGMTHVLIPYAVLPIHAALLRIDPALLLASDGLGASRATTFARVLLPLAARGVATAGAFVFLLSLGFFVTPALLGGPGDTTLPILIDGFVNERLDWPLAAAASTVLLAMAGMTVAAVGRFLPAGTLATAR
ncbi:MAG: ABC transporter permease [Acidisphaera sp.]|nr:ABC transporter permease [Acidisphaera sp.]